MGARVEFRNNGGERSLVDIILADHLSSLEIEAQVLQYAQGKDHLSLVQELTLNQKEWERLYGAISNRALHPVVLEAVAGIRAKSEVMTRGTSTFLGYSRMSGLARILHGQKMTTTEFGSYLKQVEWLPDYTLEQEEFFQKLEEGDISSYGTEDLEGLLRLTDKSMFSLVEGNHLFSRYFKSIHERLKDNPALQAAILQKVTGYKDAALLRLAGNESHQGYRSLGRLHHLFTGNARNSPTEIGDYFRELLMDQSCEGDDLQPINPSSRIARLRAQREGELVGIILDSTISTDEVKQRMQDYASGKTPRELLLELPTQKKGLIKKLHEAVVERGLEADLFYLATGIAALEEVTAFGDALTPGISELKGLMHIISGRSLRYKEVREYIADHLGVPPLSTAHQDFVDHLHDYVQRLCPEELLQRLGENKHRSLDRGQQSFDGYGIELGRVLSQDQKLQLALTRKLRDSLKAVNQNARIHIRRVNALLAGSTDVGVQAATHIRNLRSVYPDIRTVEEAKAAIEDYGMPYLRQLGITDGSGRILTAMATTIFPNLLTEYIHLRKEGKSVRDWVQAERCSHIYALPSIERLHTIKLAQDSEGRFLDQRDYHDLIRNIFADSVILQGVDEKSRRYVRQGDLSKVTITEQIVDTSTKNPNFRIRMWLSTNTEQRSDNTLEAFLKSYSSQEERDVDTAVNRYLADVVGLESIGRAREIDLKRHLIVEQDQGPETRTVVATNFKDRSGKGAGYGLVMAFRHGLTNLAHYLQSDDVDVRETLREVNTAVAEFHSKGFYGLSQLKSLSAKHRAIIQGRMQNKSYSQQFEHFVAPEGSVLHAVYDALGIGKDLDSYASKHKSFVHGDLHGRNIALVDNRIVFFDYERAGVGIAQEDLTKYLGERRFCLSLDMEKELIADYMEKRGVDDPEFLHQYHLMTIQKELEICRFNADHGSTFATQKDYLQSFNYHLKRLEKHAAEVFPEAKVRNLVSTVQNEFSNVNIQQAG